MTVFSAGPNIFRIIRLLMLGLALTVARVAADELTRLARIPLEGSESSPFWFDVAALGEPGRENLPVGVFDSGVGGLTVLEQILLLDDFDNKTGEPGSDGRADFADERFIYLGDQANMPYGNYPSEQRTVFLRELVLKDAMFLLGDRYWPSRDAARPSHGKPPVKAIVIACNTATAYGLEDIRRAIGMWDVPVFVVGVVEAGARGALAEGGGEGAIAVMATVGTCSSLGYVRAVEKVWRARGIAPAPVVQQGCLGLAGAIEGDSDYLPASSGQTGRYRGPAPSNPLAPFDTTIIEQYGFGGDGILRMPGSGEPVLASVDSYIRYHVLSLVRGYRESGGTEPIGSVILGCTHFPFHSGAFAESFDRLRSLETVDGGHPYSGLISGELVFIDPAVYTARELYTGLRERGLMRPAGEGGDVTDEFYISVASPSPADGGGEALGSDGAFTYEYKYSRSPGRLDIEYVRRVPMHAGNLGSEAVSMLRSSTPAVWRRLVRFNSESCRLSSVADSLRLQ